jgi:hypothetical protein
MCLRVAVELTKPQLLWLAMLVVLLLSCYSYNPFVRLCHSQWPRGVRRGSVGARLLELQVRIPPAAGCQVDVSASGWSLVQRRWWGVSRWVRSWFVDNEETLAYLRHSRRGRGMHCLLHTSVYCLFTSPESPSLCIATCSTTVTNLTVLLPQSRDCNCYVSRRILAPSSLRLPKINELRPHDWITQSPDLLPQPGFRKITCARSWRLYGISPAIQHVLSDLLSLPFSF